MSVHSVVLKQAPDAIPKGLWGWGSRKDNMEITWEVRSRMGMTQYDSVVCTENMLTV